MQPTQATRPSPKTGTSNPADSGLNGPQTPPDVRICAGFGTCAFCVAALVWVDSLPGVLLVGTVWGCVLVALSPMARRRWNALRSALSDLLTPDLGELRLTEQDVLSDRVKDAERASDEWRRARRAASDVIIAGQRLERSPLLFDAYRAGFLTVEQIADSYNAAPLVRVSVGERHLVARIHDSRVPVALVREAVRRAVTETSRKAGVLA